MMCGRPLTTTEMAVKNMHDDAWYESRAYRLAMLTGLLQACSSLSLWCFSTEGTLYFSSNTYAQELNAFLEIGGCKHYALTVGKTLDKPFIMSDSMGLLWVGEYSAVTESTDRFLVLMGPVFIAETSMQTINERMRERNISLSMQSIGRKILTDIPVVTMPMLHQYIKMLHFTATGNILQLQDIVYQTDMADTPVQAVMDTPPSEKHFTDYEKSHAHEQALLQCIREGNMNYTQVLGNLGLRTTPDDYLTGDPLREAKDTVIIFIAICSRASIEGKLSVKAAKEIEVRYIRRIERSATITEVSSLRQAAMAEYISRIHDLAGAPGVSQPVRDCCDYIKAHFMEKLTLSDIARSVCYSEYYLTRKFQREMGQSLWDYIWNIRLEHARIQLVSTQDSIQEISEKLQFGTRNHFTKVFREREGCTPTQYRERSRLVGGS